MDVTITYYRIISRYKYIYSKRAQTEHCKLFQIHISDLKMECLRGNLKFCKVILYKFSKIRAFFIKLQNYEAQLQQNNVSRIDKVSIKLCRECLTASVPIASCLLGYRVLNFPIQPDSSTDMAKLTCIPLSLIMLKGDVTPLLFNKCPINVRHKTNLIFVDEAKFDI